MMVSSANKAEASLNILGRCRTVSRPTALWIAYLALAALLAVPLLLVEVPLASDTLNHLARIHVRAHIADAPDLASNSKWLLTVVGSAVPGDVIQALDGASGHPCCWRALGLRVVP